MKKRSKLNSGNSLNDGYTFDSSERKNSDSVKSHSKAVKTVILTIVFLILLLCGIGFIYVSMMMSRLNRSDPVNSEALQQYEEQPSEAPQWAVKTQQGVMNILLLGVDENDDGSDGRSDSMMLISIDSDSKAIRLVSFLRDSYLEIPTIGKKKLNAAYSNGGVALTMQTLENNFRIDVDHYVSINFENFAAVIDKMGGLDVPMSKATCREMNKNIGTHFKEGINHLNGAQCLYYARIRHATDEFGHDDYGRTSRQRQIIQLMIQKIKGMNLLQSSQILYDYLPYVKTNLNDSEILYLASIGVDLSSYKIESMQIPAPDTFTDKSDVPGAGDVLVLDLEKNCALLRQFLYGETIPSESSD
ncbi:LCP family protein [Thermocaproicibacter melissae]|uniref:LCP family protein n=1 Tax=Thermocaproicibacter melissae TaxID=2966552 RepID=UPI0024B12E70|nr:LCP family protein [Thermocaproicibacter melissae]WBY64299.1 LCP family protein [Thermocaproicibacter melissae]